MRVVIAPDSFKGSIGAADGGGGARRGLAVAPARRRGGLRCRWPTAARAPLDGAGRGRRRGPLAPRPGQRARRGAPVTARWLELPGGCASSSSPSASRAAADGRARPARRADHGRRRAASPRAGRRRQPDRDRARAARRPPTAGPGRWPRSGARFLDAGRAGAAAAAAGRWPRLASADLTGLRPPPPGGVACLTDVRAPLLGPAAARRRCSARRRAPTRRRWSSWRRAWPGWPSCSAASRAQPGAGAAGGTGYGLAAAWGAELAPGAAELGRIAGLDAALAGAGPGHHRRGPLRRRPPPTGKVVGGRAGRRRPGGVPAALVAGAIAADPPPGIRRRWRWPSWPGERPRRWPSPRAGCGRPAAELAGSGLARPAPEPLAWARAGDRGIQRQRPPRPGRRDMRRTSASPSRPVRLTRFANDCLEVQLQANCRERDVFLIQPLGPPVQENLVELLLMLDAARGASAARVTAVIPHYAYARSDKKAMPRVSIGGRLVADLLVTAGVEPGAGHDPARPAGARLLLGARRPPARAARAGRSLRAPATSATPSSSRPTWATPSRPPRWPGCSACRWRPAPRSGTATPASRSARSSARWPAGT